MKSRPWILIGLLTLVIFFTIADPINSTPLHTSEISTTALPLPGTSAAPIIQKPLVCYNGTSWWNGRQTGDKIRCSADTTFCYIIVGRMPKAKNTRYFQIVLMIYEKRCLRGCADDWMSKKICEVSAGNFQL